jgi:hypothetical protein
MSRLIVSDLRGGGRIVPPTLTATLSLSLQYTFPDGRLRRYKALHSPVVVLFYASFVDSARTGHPRSLSSSQHNLIFSLAELPSQVVMSVPNVTSRKGTIYLCSCGCNRRVSRQTVWRHLKRAQPESPPPPKRCRVDASDHPQLRAPSLDNFNPSLPLLDLPPASNLLQPSGDASALTEASESGLFVDDFLRNLHTRTHQSDDEDSEGALGGDAVEAADDVDHDTDDFTNGEDVAVEGDADPREGIVSDWDLLAEEFIVEAEELGKFGHSLLHTS